ncbi:hypothetical protein HOH87_01735 [bacterium]|jgi:hypothetical protein|nr:hypothetical protein [bacterium]
MTITLPELSLVPVLTGLFLALLCYLTVVLIMIALRVRKLVGRIETLTDVKGWMNFAKLIPNRKKRRPKKSSSKD